MERERELKKKERRKNSINRAPLSFLRETQSGNEKPLKLIRIF